MNSAPSDSFTISWRPTLADAYAALHLGFWGTPARMARTLILLLVFPMLLFGWLVHLSMGSRLSLLGLIGIAVVGGLAWAIFFGIAFGAWLARFILNSQRAKGDPQQIVVGPDTIERVLVDSKVIHPWTAISHIEETRPAFILIGPGGPVSSIEKSGIASAAELRALRAFLRAKKPGKFLDEST